MNKLEKLSKNHVWVDFEQSGRNKGITLVALVITIIVLIILAGVSINAIMNKGIITNAKDAKNIYENSKKEEEKVLEDLEIDEVAMDFLMKGIPYEFKNTFLTGIEQATEALALMKELSKAGYDLYDKNGNQITNETPDTTLVTTGMEIKKDGNKIGNVVIYGDLNCDGYVDAGDRGYINALLSGNNNFANYQIVAMDTDHNGIIDYNDINNVVNYSTYKIEQNYKAANVDSLVLKDINYEINEYAKVLTAKNNGYSITKEENGYVLNGVQSGIIVQTLLDALPENTNAIKIKNPMWKTVDPTSTIVAGTYAVYVTSSYLGPESDYKFAEFVIE